MRACRWILALFVAHAVAGAALAQEATPEDSSFEDRGFYQSYIFGSPSNPTDAWLQAYGGRLYDNWWAVLFLDPPEVPHSAYPSVGKAEGAETWRCVTCHGWDTKGRDGVLGEGYFYTGIKGIRGKMGAPEEEIVALLRAAPHGYNEDLLPKAAARALAVFVSRGQGQDDDAYDSESGQFKGDPERGRAIFQNVCAICHDFDGGAWIEGDDGLGSTLSTIANGDPARALHKVMNGQTYADMPAMRVFGMEAIRDVLSYVQTLPVE